MSSQSKSSQFYHYLTFCVMVLLASCQNPKDEILPQEVKSGKTTETSQNSFRTIGDSIIQKNGRLVFKDANVFGNTMIALSNMSSEEKQTFESRFESYSSWRKYNEDRLNNENAFPLYFDTKVTSLPDFFTAVVNSKREYQVGSVIIYLEEGETFEIPENQENNLKQEGWFKASTLANFQTNSLRTEGDGRYQYQYWRGNTEYKHVFEVARFEASGFSALYIKQKLEYWGRVSWFRKDWRAAGEVRTMHMNGISGFSRYGNAAQISMTPASRSLVNGVGYNELMIRSIPTALNISMWTYSINASFMEMFVPSHGQISQNAPAPFVGLPKLFVFNATFTR